MSVRHGGRFGHPVPVMVMGGTPRGGPPFACVVGLPPVGGSPFCAVGLPPEGGLPWDDSKYRLRQCHRSVEAASFAWYQMGIAAILQIV